MLVGLDTARPRSIEELLTPGLSAVLDRLDLHSRKVLAGVLPGERRSKRRGRSVEFDDFREYAPGDDLRHVDWNIYARLDRLVMKVFREEEDLALDLLVDASASMDAGRPSKSVYAHRLALALAYVGLVRANRVSVALMGRDGARVERLEPLRGRVGVHRVAEFLLSGLGPRGRGETPDPGAAVREFARRRTARGITVVISDLLAPGDAAEMVAPLAAGPPGGRDAYVVHVLAPGEIDPERERRDGLWGDVKLTDAETGREAEVTISGAECAAYRRRAEGWRRGLRAGCLARGVGYLFAPTDVPVEAVVLSSLRRAGLLR